MDWLEIFWLGDNKIPVGKAAKYVFDGLKANFSPLFDAIVLDYGSGSSTESCGCSRHLIRLSSSPWQWR